jgi:uncharacterized membrane protein YdjX (TVP38/TMEM64 family)
MIAILASPRIRLGLIGAILLGGSLAALFAGGPSSDELEDAVRGTGALGPAAFVALYAGLTVLLFPGAVGSIAGGALFGVAGGTALTVVGATIGATASFAIGRRLGRAQVEAISGARLERLDAFLGRRGFLAVLWARLIPVVPFNLLNYGAGLTGVTARDYVLATAIGIVPGSFAYSAIGSSLGDPTGPVFLGSLGLLAALTAIGVLASRRRGARD